MTGFIFGLIIVVVVMVTFVIGIRMGDIEISRKDKNNHP